MSIKIDLINKRFGRLTVISESHSDGKHIYWNCLCDCGQEKIISGDSLKRGLTKSCGCLNSETSKERFSKHGKSGSRLYKIWQQMIYRCENSNATGFEYWGGKGITVCGEWRNNFQVFYDWAMSNGYSDDLTIDRIRPHGDYEPSNCQWLTRSENAKKVWSDKKDFGVKL